MTTPHWLRHRATKREPPEWSCAACQASSRRPPSPSLPTTTTPQSPHKYPCGTHQSWWPLLHHRVKGGIGKRLGKNPGQRVPRGSIVARLAEGMGGATVMCASWCLFSPQGRDWCKASHSPEPPRAHPSYMQIQKAPKLQNPFKIKHSHLPYLLL